MKTKTLIAAVAAAVSVTITLTACGSSSSGASHSITQDATSTTVASTPVTRPSTLVDELVPVHGGRLHVHCDGAGPTTVVLIAGFNTSSSIWAATDPTLSQTTRVCSYDRFGTGTSDAPQAAQTFATQAADLHALLQSIGDAGPYVVVGHSFGGAEAVTFASMYPTDVRGLLLLDASPATWNTDICTESDDVRNFQTLCAQLSTPANNDERLDAPTAFAEVAAITSLGAFPMTVATVDHHSFLGLAPTEEARLNDVWNAGQEHWASLNSSAQLVSIDHTGHNVQLDRPDVVIDKIHELLP